MPGQRETRQKAAAGHDAYAAGRDLIINDDARAAELGVPGLLPRDVPAFTGREEELARLAALAGGGRVVVSAIGGTAGVGKTALAVHAAHQLLGEFPDGHLYADLRGYTEGQVPAEPGEVLEVFLRHLGVPAEEVPATVEDRSGLLRQVLADRRVLMVLDNARAEAQVRPLLPGTGGSLVLVTSRSLMPGLEVDERISLDILPEDEATAMLTGVIGTARSAAGPQVVAETARLCGRLPLALRIAGQLLAAHPAWPVGRLAEMLAGEQDRLARLGAGDLQVQAAFKVSYQQLAEEDARLFRLLGLHPGPDLTTAAAAALVGIEPEAAVPVLDRLAEAHLVSEDAAGRFVMHDLLRLFARATCQETDSPADRTAAEARLVDDYASLAKYLNSCLDPQLRPAAEQEAGQVGKPFPSLREALARLVAERGNLLAVVDLAARRSWDEHVIRLAERIGEWLAMLHYLDDLLTVEKAALAAARHARGAAEEIQALNNLGIAYRRLRRFDEAVDCYQQALAIFRETGDQHGEGQTLNGLGLAYRRLRRFDEAVDCHQQALAIFRETGDQHNEGLALNDLGRTYQELRRFDEAVDCHQQALAICRETGDRHGEGLALNDLGRTYQELRRFDEAVDCHQQALAIFRETGDRHNEGLALNDLGRTYQELRERDRAVMCWWEAAAAMRDAGDHEEAELLEQRAADARARRRRWWRRGDQSAGI